MLLITRLRNRARVIRLQGWRGRRRLFTLREGYCAGRYYNWTNQIFIHSVYVPEVDVVGPLMNREHSGASLRAEVIFNALNTPGNSLAGFARSRWDGMYNHVENNGVSPAITNVYDNTFAYIARDFKKLSAIYILFTFKIYLILTVLYLFSLNYFFLYIRFVYLCVMFPFLCPSLRN